MKQLVIATISLSLAPALMASGSTSAATTPQKPFRKVILKPMPTSSLSGTPSPVSYAASPVTVPNAGWAFSPIGNHRGIAASSPKSSKSAPVNLSPLPLKRLALTGAYSSQPNVTTLPPVATATAAGHTAPPSSAAQKTPAIDLDGAYSAEMEVKMLRMALEERDKTIAQLEYENADLRTLVASQDESVKNLTDEYHKMQIAIAELRKIEAERQAAKEDRRRRHALLAAASASPNVPQVIAPPAYVQD